MRLVLYGDFNCPFSALASRRAAALEAGGASVDWRAVEHDRGIPPHGQAVEGALAEEIDEEIARVQGLLGRAEAFALRRPPVRARTGPAIAAYAGVAPELAAQARAALFDAYWLEGRDIGSRAVLAELGLLPPAREPEVVARWYDEWTEVGHDTVPVLRAADGTVTRGLDALERLRP